MGRWLVEKETRFHELGNSQSIQTAKYAEIRFSVRKMNSGEKGQGVARQLFAGDLKGTKYHSIQSYRGLFEEIRCVIRLEAHGAPPPTSAEAKIKNRII